jgi:hypothetical protein
MRLAPGERGRDGLRGGGLKEAVDARHAVLPQKQARNAKQFSLDAIRLSRAGECRKLTRMKKYLPAVAGFLLGALFVWSAVVVLFHLVKMPPIPPETPAGHFFAAIGPTGYMTFVKIIELTGGLLVMIPRTRNFGLLALGPVIVNILAFHAFLGTGVKGLLDPMIAVIVVLPLYLLWAGRNKFAGLLG